jgi:hypothetical protein
MEALMQSRLSGCLLLPVLGVCASLATPSPSRGQAMKVQSPRVAVDPSPMLTRIFPPAAVVGKTVECVVEGQNLRNVEKWTISGADLSVITVDAASNTSVRLRIAVAENAETTFRELRAVNSAGLSNGLIIRVDSLEPLAEIEPNDEPAKAQSIAIGQAVSGTLRKEDVDYFEFDAKAGAHVTLEVEARRLGTGLTPVLTLSTATGGGISQVRQSRGIDRDCRLDFRPPADGTYVVQVRDNTYLGAEGANYRLRIDPAPFATAIYPLGGPAGQALTITASGGSLTGPVTKQLVLPGDEGETVAVGSFDGPAGRLSLPQRVIASDAEEIEEAAVGPEGPATTTLHLGSIANGRIARPEEADLYKLSLRQGEAISLRVRAAELGSWLDSVLVLRDSTGNIVAENDDLGIGANVRQQIVNNVGVPRNSDSRIDFAPKASGDYTLEVFDRYGDGGPEYAYRLEASAEKPDFSIGVFFADPNLNPQLLVANGPALVRPPGSLGVLNLRPGTNMSLNYFILPEGNTGPIALTVEGLPAGVSAEAVTIRPNPPANANAQIRVIQTRGAVSLRVQKDAPAGEGEIRVLGVAKTKDGREIRRIATATIGVAGVAIPATLPLTRTVSNLVVHVPKTPP